MTSLRCVALFVFVLGVSVAPAQQTTPDERAARVAERYKTMLLANPVDGLALDRLWKSYDERGASGALLDEFRAMAAAPGASAAPVLIYGHLLQRAGRLDEAGASYERAEMLDPASPLPPLAGAELALARSHADDAAGFFARAIEKLPAGDRRQPEILQKLGAAWMSAGQPKKAAEAWEQIIAHDPGNLGLRRQLAENYERNGMPERALALYEYVEAHADPAERAAVLRDVARLHEARGEFDAASGALERGLTLTSHDNWLHRELEARLIRLYQRADRVPELETRWRAAVEMAPRDLGAVLRLETLAEAQGDAAGERAALEKLVALAPRETDYTRKLARRLADDGDRGRAGALYDGLLKVRPDNLDLILARAELDLQIGQPEVAVGRLEARIARNPADESVTTPALAFFLDHHLTAAAERRLRAEATRQPAADQPALALATFLFAQRKPEEARLALAALTDQPDDAAARAARWTQAADLFRAQNLAPDALHAWQEAAALQPRAAAPLLAAGEFLLAHGDRAGATEQFRRAASAASGSEQVDAERKWFDALASSDSLGAPTVASGIVISGLPTLHDTHAAPTGRAVGEVLAQWEKAAAADPTGDGWLRLARWQSWAHLSGPAFESVTRAVAADPANAPARELAANLAVELHRPDDAEAQWRELARRDPAHKNDHLRQLGSLKLDAGDFDAAVSIFTQLQQATPGSREALIDLALAQQRADRWYDALATWEHADALPSGTPAQREEVRRPLLAAYERLGQFTRAAEVLRGAVDAQADPVEKIDLFHELAGLWHRYDLGPDLRADYEKRLTTRPDDYFLLTALAELRRDEGQENEAFALQRQAYFSSPDPARSLRELVEQAEQLGDDTQAVAEQRRLVALPGEATAANLEKLAALQVENLDESVAARTWESAVAKFPRDTAVLGHAAEFFQLADQPDRARELLRQLVAVDGTDHVRLLRLGTLDAQAGDVPAARAHFEQLLAQTAPETADEPLSVPGELEARAEPGSLLPSGRSIYPMVGGEPRRARAPATPISDERRLRLQAIESLSRLLFPKQSTLDGPQQEWLQRWQANADAGAKSEPLAAFYFSSQPGRTLDLLARWVGRDDSTGDTALGAFLNAGLRLGDYRPLADWAWHADDRSLVAARGQKLLGALETFLRAGGKPGPGIVADLFPADVRGQEMLWAAAQGGFAVCHWYTQAAELGERVLAKATSARASYAVETADWELSAGNPDRARDALRQAVEDPDAGGSDSTDPPFLALRSYYLLLPPPERAAFVAQHLGRRALQGRSVQALLEGALLHGLSGAGDAAGRDLDQLLAMRLLSTTPLELSPDIRRWTYLLNCGDQLERWNLEPLAIHLWRHALAEAGGFDRQPGDVDNTVSGIRYRLLRAEVATAADPQEVRERTEEFLSEQTEPAAINGVATELWNDGQHEAAAQLYETLYRVDPKNTDYWPNLYDFYETGGNQGATETLLSSLLAGGRPLPGVSRADLACDLASSYEKGGDVPRAIRRLEQARQAMPGNLPVLVQLAQTDERANRWDDAAKAWGEAVPLDPGHAARLGLATVEERRGHRAAAVEILRGGLKDGPDPGREELVVQLTQTLLADHRPDEARRLAVELTGKGQVEPLPAIGAAFTAAGQRTVAQELLSAAVRRTRAPAVRFHLQQALAEQAADPADFERQMRRLGKFAQASEALRIEYDDLLYPLAHERGADAWLEGELQRTWKHGLGDPAAGVRLAGLFLQRNREDALREVVQSIDHRTDLPEDLLYRLATSLVDSNHAPLALALCERLATRFPQKLEYRLVRAQALWKSDRRPDANQCLAELANRAVFQENILGPIAAFYLRFGEKALAAEYLERIVQSDPAAARAPQSWLQLAQLALDENRLPDAERLLRVVCARPEATDLGPLVRYLKASGQLDGERALEMPARDFPLSFERRALLLAAIRDDLIRNGRAEDGRRLIERHAEFLAATPALAAEIACGVTPTTIKTIVDCLERAVEQRAPVPAELGHTLAGLYTQWATWDANDPAAQGVAFAHLTRAFGLEPGNLAVAGQLAKLCLRQKQPEQAAKVLEAFLAPDALPSEREQARQILASP